VQRAVVPQVIDGLANHIGGEVNGNIDEPKQAPRVVAAQLLVQIKCDCFVLALFGCVPTPQGLDGRVSVFKPIAFVADAL
jgi:hypothetical protein